MIKKTLLGVVVLTMTVIPSQAYQQAHYAAPAYHYSPAPVYHAPAPVYRAPAQVYRAPVYRAPINTYRIPRTTYNNVRMNNKQFKGPILLHHGPVVIGGRTTLPSDIHHNPAHRIGSWGSSHNHRAFVYRHNGHRWHRYYYTWFGGGVYTWYWYDTVIDSSAVADDGVTLDDATSLPDCDPNVDACSSSD